MNIFVVTIFAWISLVSWSAALNAEGKSKHRKGGHVHGRASP